MSFRQLSKEGRRLLARMPEVTTPVTIAQRIKILYPEQSEYYLFQVTETRILFKTKDLKVTIAEYPISMTGFLLFVYEMDLNIATALMYYAEGGK